MKSTNNSQKKPSIPIHRCYSSTGIGEFEALVATWKEAYKITQPTKKQKQKRLQELLTWDDSNGHHTEREAKSEALRRLLNGV